MGPVPAASTGTAGSGSCGAPARCLTDSWLRAQGCSVVPPRWWRPAARGVCSQHSPRNPPQARPITQTGKVRVPPRWPRCWGMLPHGAKLCSGRQPASPQFLCPVPPVSPVQRSWEFIPAGDRYASSQKLLPPQPRKWPEMFQKKG